MIKKYNYYLEKGCPYVLLLPSNFEYFNSMYKEDITYKKIDDVCFLYFGTLFIKEEI